MANKAVFLDRDRTIIEDPGYLSAPEAVKLLPGAELAIRSLAQAGFRIVVVTNQSGIARGLLTEEALEQIHAELRRQLSERGAHLDAIYHCPYHPEGTVERYAIESDLRKPSPGMLVRAAEELDIDLKSSWMVGDGARDIEAGPRAGCRTIRVRVPGHHPVGEAADEAVQADYTVRNLVDAARVVLRESLKPPGAEAVQQPTAAPRGLAAPAPAPSADTADRQPMEQTEMLREILHHLRRLDRAAEEEFSIAKVVGGIFQVFAGVALLMVLARMIGGKSSQETLLWAAVAGVLQLIALTFFIMRRSG